MDTSSDEPGMDAQTAALLHRLLIVAEDLRYAVREGRLDDFREDCIVQNEPDIAEQASIPTVALVLPAYEMAMTTEAPLTAPPVPAPATAWELADLLQRLLTDCRGVRGIDSPAAPRPNLLYEVEALLKRVARDEQKR